MKYTFYKKLLFSGLFFLIGIANVLAQNVIVQNAAPDLPSSNVLCDKETAITINQFDGAGTDTNEATDGCLDGITETNTTWFVWQAEDFGDFTFNISPTDGGDLFGYSLFRLPNGLLDGTNKAILRCVSPCRPGDIGLRTGEGSTDGGDCGNTNGFLRPLGLDQGFYYALMVENTTSNSGFTITFGGDGPIVSPVGEIQPVVTNACYGQAIELNQNVDFQNGSITNYSWNIEDNMGQSEISVFGADRNSFTYDILSINDAVAGDKNVFLTVTTSIDGTTQTCQATFDTQITIDDCCDSDNSVEIIDTTITQVACPSDANGAIVLEVNQPNPLFPNSYEWSNSATTKDITGLVPDTYSVTVSNDAGCKDSLTYTFDNPNVLSARDTVLQMASCAGGTDGIIEIVTTGGRMPYTYDFNDGNGPASSNQLTNLPIGDYSVTVTDDSGCQEFISAIEVTEKEIQITLENVVNPTCADTEDGRIEISSNNSTISTLQFNINNGERSGGIDILSELGPGRNIIDVIDDEGCMGGPIDTILVSPPALNATIESRGITCSGASDGTAIVTANGGTGDFTYQWSDGSTTRSISGLEPSPDPYSVTVTDENGCMLIRSTPIISDPEPLTATVISTSDVSCNNVNDGEIILEVSGGTTPYSYSFDGLSTVNGTTISDLSTGDYDITVTDNFGCEAIIPTTSINSPALISFAPIAQADVCYGQPVQFTNLSTFTTGNVASVSWDFGNGITSTDENPEVAFTTIGRPTVILTVTSDLGCSDVLTQELDFSVEPCCDTENAILFAPEIIEPLCNGGNGGEISLNTGFSLSPVPITSISWATGDSTDNVSGLTAGSYGVTITNDATCEESTFFTVTEPDPITATLDITQPTCDAAANGMITVTAQGGTINTGSDYSFNFNNSTYTTNNTAQDLMIGVQNIMIRDDNNCEVPFDTVLAVPADSNPISANLEINAPTCDVATNGLIRVNATGNGPLLYNFDGTNFTTNDSISNLTIGNYSVVIQDADNCELSIDTLLAVPADSNPINANLEINSPSCDAATNGLIRVNATGNGPFLYNFDGTNFTSNDSISSLTIGNYRVVIQDADNCELPIDTVLSVPANFEPVTAAITGITLPSCGGGSDGSITIAPNGELGDDIANYTFDFGNNGAGPNNTVDNIAAGVPVLVVVTNTNNCSATVDTILNELVLEPATPLVEQPSCFGELDGRIRIQVLEPQGVQGPFMYAVNGGTFQDEMALADLGEGDYEIIVQDFNECLSDTISVNVPQPDEIELTVTPQEISCFEANDGQIMATVTGGNGNLTFEWNNGQTTMTATGLAPDDYFVTVTDFRGCRDSTTMATTLTQPLELLASLGPVTPVLCFGETNGTITVDATGGSGTYEYSLDGVIFQPSATLENLSAGNYNVVIRDDRGCEVPVDNITVDEPGEFIVTANIDNEITRLGFPVNLSAAANTTAIGAINYVWSTPDSIICNNCERFETVPPGSTTFTVTAINSDNCQATDAVSVRVSLDRPVYIPNIFSPNGDGVNDEFYIPFSPSMSSIKNLKIFDRSGSLVFEVNDIAQGEELIKAWDGEFNGSKLRQGVFVITAEINFVDGQTLPYRSDLTLITSE